MLKSFRADLHIHTCLSPCGDLRMLPTNIVQKAKMEGLDVIGICDHNASENVIAIKKVGERAGLSVLGGVEVLDSFQKIVYEYLSGVNNEDLFGPQYIAGEQDNIQYSNEHLLIGATELSIDEIVNKVHHLRGIVIASHVDRERFGIYGQLGIVPENLFLDGLELSSKCNANNMNWNRYNYPVVTFSDAHCIEDIGKNSTTFNIDSIKMDELKKALTGRYGRSLITHFGHC
jgi:PHP family Zn ribbon phosphoesterase